MKLEALAVASAVRLVVQEVQLPVPMVLAGDSAAAMTDEVQSRPLRCSSLAVTTARTMHYYTIFNKFNKPIALDLQSVGHRSVSIPTKSLPSVTEPLGQVSHTNTHTHSSVTKQYNLVSV